MFIAPQLYSLMRLSNANMIGSLYSEFDIYTSWGCDESGEHCGHYINNDALAFLAILQSQGRSTAENDKKAAEKKQKKTDCFAELKFNQAGHGTPSGVTHSFWYMFVAPQLYMLMRQANANMVGSLSNEFDLANIPVYGWGFGAVH
jgi:hypothetical protein